MRKWREDEGSVLAISDRSSRRQSVVLIYLCLVALMLIFGFAKSNWLFVLAVGLMFGAMVGYVNLLFPITKEITRRKGSELDERQLALRDRAYFSAYRILGVIFLLTVVYTIAAATPGFIGGVRLPAPGIGIGFSLVFLLIFYLIISLPAAVIAWTEPDTEEEVDAEEGIAR